ncbi:MAG: hypothetical protein GX061_08845 [Eubacteriaceae bacterium]|nr:hypothetical protein [Eubacteriaceae bacterium]
MEYKNTRPVNWLLSVLLGGICATAGIIIAFFPAMLMKAGLIAAAVILLSLGAGDIVAAIKYKDSTPSWKLTLIAGLVNILVSAFLVIAFYTGSFAGMTILIVLCLWAFLRGGLLSASVIIGKQKRNKNLIASFAEILLGILLFIFRNFVMASGKIIGIVFIAAGALLLIIGFYIKAAQREKKLTALSEENGEKAQNGGNSPQAESEKANLSSNEPEAQTAQPPEELPNKAE